MIKDLANLYGHLCYGVDYILLEDRRVKVKAYCIDLANNVSEERLFTTYLTERIYTLLQQKKSNAYDEVYKFVYQEAIKRMRVCIEHILPLWVKEKALKLILNKKHNFYDVKQNREKSFSSIFEGFKKINPEIKTLKDLSKFIDLEVTEEKLKNPKFFTQVEELYIGYRDEKSKENGKNEEAKKEPSIRDRQIEIDNKKAHETLKKLQG